MTFLTHHRKLITKGFKVEVHTFFPTPRGIFFPLTSSDARHKFRFNFSRGGRKVTFAIGSAHTGSLLIFRHAEKILSTLVHVR